MTRRQSTAQTTEETAATPADVPAASGNSGGGRTSRRRLDAATRREIILAAAVDAFASASYDKVRVADIATRIGVTEPVIYQNYGTKADLFAAVLDHTADQFAADLRALSDGTADVLMLLSRLLGAEHIDQLHTRGNLGALFTDSTARRDEQVHQRVRQASARLAAATAQLLARGQADRSIRDDIEPTALAWYVLSQLRARQFRRTNAHQLSPVLEDAVLAATLETLRPRQRGQTSAPTTRS